MDKLDLAEEPSVWLAPMSGATDAPFRKQVVRFGADLVVSEMTASEQLIQSRPDVVRRASRHAGSGPWIVQLAGRNPKHMEAAARLLATAGVDMIDINMGCPSRKVTGGLSGSALMREPELADQIIEATLEGAQAVPVSLKMRLGWDEAMLNAPELAERAERAGIVRLTVHGRTRCQFYKGAADWAQIAHTVQAVNIPVVANGDICSLETARQALQLSGASGVMIGRAAIGLPWRVAEIKAGLANKSFVTPDLPQRFDYLHQQVVDAVALYGERTGVRVCRKHISATLEDTFKLEGAETLKRLKSEVCTIDDSGALIKRLEQIFIDGRIRVAA